MAIRYDFANPSYLKLSLYEIGNNDLHWVEINQDVRFTYVNWQGEFIAKVQQHVLSPVKKW